MALRPDEIEGQRFTKSLRGYDTDEVDAFLALVAASTRELGAAAPEPAAPALEETADDEFATDSSDLFTTQQDSDSEYFEMAIIDRYGALGDRIADLLRNANQSANQLRDAAQVDAASITEEAGAKASQMLDEARLVRNEVDAYRKETDLQADAQSASSKESAESILAEATAAAEQIRQEAVLAASSLEAEAAESAADVRAKAAEEGTASLADKTAETDELHQLARQDRETAHGELANVRAQVAGLLEQARAQSEFIKQEAEEIIRAKVRANMERAQDRIDVLRNTEVASRERIVSAQRELSAALTRLDAEELPALDPHAEREILEEAARRGREIGITGMSASVEADQLPDESTTDDGPAEAAVDEGLIEADIVDSGSVDDSPEDESFPDDGAADDSDDEFEVVDAEVIEPGLEAAGQAAEVTRLPAPEPDQIDSDLPGHEAEILQMPSTARSMFGARTFGADLPTRSQDPVANDEEFTHGSHPAFESSISESDAAPFMSGGYPDIATADVPASTDQDLQEEEDALARLVRVAMKDAVEDARRSD